MKRLSDINLVIPSSFLFYLTNASLNQDQLKNCIVSIDTNNTYVKNVIKSQSEIKLGIFVKMTLIKFLHHWVLDYSILFRDQWIQHYFSSNFKNFETNWNLKQIIHNLYIEWKYLL